MKWIVRIGLALAAVMGVIAGVGAILPVAHTATVVREITAGPEVVWTVLTDVEAFPQWRSGLDSVERLDDSNGRPAWREQSGSQAISFQVTEWDAPHLLATRIVGEGLPFGGSWRIETEPVESGTRVSITEAGEVYNPVFRFVSRFVMGHDATLNQYLDDLENYVAST